jgi:hypothetical protein
MLKPRAGDAKNDAKNDAEKDAEILPRECTPFKSGYALWIIWSSFGAEYGCLGYTCDLIRESGQSWGQEPEPGSYIVELSGLAGFLPRSRRPIDQSCQGGIMLFPAKGEVCL